MYFLKENKLLFKLIASLCIVLVIFNFSTSSYVYADDATEIITGIGGDLLQPLVQLVVSLGDAIMAVIHDVIMGEKTSYIAVDTSAGIASIVIGVVAAVGVIIALGALIVTTMGAGFIAALPTIIGAAGSILMTAAMTGGLSYVISYEVVSGASLPEVTLFPLYSIGPQEIFEGKILLFDVNIFNPKKIYIKEKDTGNYIEQSVWNSTYPDGNTENIDSYVFFRDGNSSNQSDNNIVQTSSVNVASELKDAIAKWYYTIRNIAIIALMLVLIYVGIRILLSSTAKEKSKYKEMIKDWLVAMCLVFILHYIMVFATELTEKIVAMLSQNMGEISTMVRIVKVKDTLVDKLVNDYGYGTDIVDSTNNIINWPTNLMGKIRIDAQLQDGFTYIGYALCYLVLVIFTVTFIFTYLKRLLYVIFLTIIAPLIAISYPIDKINDGKSQAFDMWMKEYIINLLIQPFHLLLYSILVGLAADLAMQNVIYSIVVIGFMIPAEKFLRKMFGFDKASTPGFLSGAAGAAATIGAMQSLAKFSSKGLNGKNKPNGPNGKDDLNNKVNFSDISPDEEHSQQALFEKLADDGPNPNPNPSNPEDNSDDENPEDGSGNGNSGGNSDDTDPGANSNDTNPGDTNSGNDSQTSRPLPSPSNRSAQGGGKKKIKKARFGAARYVGKRFLRSIPGVLGNTSRFIARASLGAMGGAIGMAAGIATGNPGDVLKNTTAGAFAGSAIGGGLANTALNTKDILKERAKSQSEEALRATYGQNYDEKRREIAKAQIRKDKELRARIREQLPQNQRGKADVDRAVEDFIQYKEYGVKDDDIVLKAMSLKEGTQKQKIAAAKLAEASKSEKDLETSMKRFGKVKGITPEQVKSMEGMVRKINNL